MDPFVNVRIGIQYLAFLRDVVGANPTRMLAAYNLGPTHVKRYGYNMGVVKKDQKLREVCCLKKASRSPFLQPGSINKMGESRAVILGRPKIDRVFLKTAYLAQFLILFHQSQYALRRQSPQGLQSLSRTYYVNKFGGGGGKLHPRPKKHLSFYLQV